jgi:hypothetical protein
MFAGSAPNSRLSSFTLDDGREAPREHPPRGGQGDAHPPLHRARVALPQLPEVVWCQRSSYQDELLPRAHTAPAEMTIS